MMKLIADLLKPRSGKIEIGGYASPTLEAKLASIYLASNDYLPEFLSGLEYLKFVHKMYGLDCEEAEVEALFERYHMPGRHQHLVEDYSHGMRKKLQLIAAILVAPPLALIDETPNGIDVDAGFRFQKDVKSLAQAGSGVLLCSHDFNLLEAVADSVILLSHGRIREHLPTEVLLEKYGTFDNFTKTLIDFKD